MQYIDKIVFVVACGYLVGAIQWLVGQEKLTLPLLSESTDRSVIPNSPSDSDAKFISYLRRSLQILDRQAAASQQKVTALPIRPVLPELPISLPKEPERLPGIQRIETPERPASQSLATALLPSTPATPLNPPPPPSSPQPTARLSTVPVLAPRVNLPPLLATAFPANYTLVGLLESGDRSAALFKFDGITQRIQVGEPVGTSGWNLVSVANRQAVIRRDRQVRSLSVGEKF